MARQKVEICLKKENHFDHKNFVTFLAKVGTIILNLFEDRAFAKINPKM